MFYWQFCYIFSFETICRTHWLISSPSKNRKQWTFLYCKAKFSIIHRRFLAAENYYVTKGTKRLLTWRGFLHFNTAPSTVNDRKSAGLLHRLVNLHKITEIHNFFSRTPAIHARTSNSEMQRVFLFIWRVWRMHERRRRKQKRTVKNGFSREYTGQALWFLFLREGETRESFVLIMKRACEFRAW